MEPEIKILARQPEGDWINAIQAGIRSRLIQVLGTLSHNQVARTTGFHQETVRRYRATGSMKAEFVAALANHYSVNADWLLTARGAPEINSEYKQELAEQLRRIADSLDRPREIL